MPESNAAGAGRSRRLAVGVVTGVGAKGAAFLLTIVSTPLALDALGPELYGVWVTMVSLLAWLAMIDFGLANGLTPALSAAFGQGHRDLAREYVATAFWGMGAICLLAGLLAWAAWPSLDWAAILKVRDEAAGEVARAAAISVALFLATLPFAINQRVLLAFQQGLAANLAGLLVSAAGVIGIIAAVVMQTGLVGLATGFLGGQLIAHLAISLWLYGVARPELRPFARPRWRDAKTVLSLGGLFFVSQIATVIVFQKDNILITRELGPAAATPYSITAQLFAYLSTIGLLASPYLAPGFGEAHASGDAAWVRKAFWRYMTATVGIVAPAALLLALFHRPVLDLWVGPEVRPTLGTVVGLAMWTVLQAIMGPIVALLIGLGRLGRYSLIALAASIVSVVMSALLLPRFGVAAVIMASVVSYATVVLGPSVFQAWRIVGRQRAARA